MLGMYQSKLSLTKKLSKTERKKNKTEHISDHLEGGKGKDNHDSDMCSTITFFWFNFSSLNLTVH